ncbi:hypothetical protein LTR08_002781 [Meristemomyces frigidus]|nr:hypothetical protein LTR08_002781 [Meristemomyces frigidus]
MSWLSVKRRRTTGNLKTLTSVNGVANGQSRTDGTPAIPESPTTPVRTTSSTERPPTASSTPTRPPFQPAISSPSLAQADGNLFYAYARRGDDPTSRYLLTFTNAGVANEWWTLAHLQFSEITRSGPQLFSFEDPDLLPNVWKHPAFAHLKSKWKYMTFSDTNGLGGAALQGVIPVQDAQGNMLGGAAPPGPEVLLGKAVGRARSNTKENERTEERFARMMEAVERNTEQIAALTESQQRTQQRAEEAQAKKREAEGYFDMGELSAHLGRINELLAQNSEHVENLATRQQDNEENLRSTLQELRSHQNGDGPDMSELSHHLTQIQGLMEQTATERKHDSGLGGLTHHPVPAIDFSPLTDRLERVQQAVEQNSALVKALLDEGASGGVESPFWANKATPIQQQSQRQMIDMSPLTEHLEGIRTAVEQQSAHIQALVGFTSGGGEEDDVDATAGNGDGGSGRRGSFGGKAEKGLAPLGEHLEQIYNAIEEGNKLAKAVPRMDLGPLVKAQDATRAAVEAGGKTVDIGPLTSKLDALISALPKVDLDPVLEAQNATRAAIEASSKAADVGLLTGKLECLIEHLMTTHTLSKQQDGHLQEIIGKQDELGPLAGKFDGLNEHLESLREWAEFNSEQFTEFMGLQTAAREAAEEGKKGLDLEPLSGKFEVLSEHLQRLVSSMDKNAEHVQQLLETQQTAASPPTLPEIDFTPLTERLNRIHASLETQAEHQQRSSSPGSGDPKFVMSALTSHLSKIQVLTEANALHVKTLREKQSATQEKMHVAVSQTADQVRELSRYMVKSDERVKATQSQVNELVKGQSEVVQVVRELARSGQVRDLLKGQGEVVQVLKELAKNGQVKELLKGQREVIEVLRNGSRAEATQECVEELTRGQRETIDALRELARSFAVVATGCQHVVLAPPRKVGRKVVGYVYDAREGQVV